MRLATQRDGTRDGRLIVVDPTGSRYDAPTSVRTLQGALDDWDAHASELVSLEQSLINGGGQPLEFESLAAPLPRAYEWIDGSAYLNHVRLVRKARGAEPPATLESDPLVYQGGSGVLLGPRDPIKLGDESWGLDFEGEVCVVVGDTPEATQAADAHRYIRLVTICNDVSLRGLIPNELAKGFGFFQSKPATAFAPFVATPDELGDAWKDGRLHLPLHVTLNGKVVGQTDAGPEMHFSFYQLIEHVTRTRSLTAGTIIGSGTVSNEDRTKGISCLAERRMIEIISDGKAATGFLRTGDSVRIEMFTPEGASGTWRDRAESSCAMKLRLFGYWRSSSSWRVRIALHLKGLEFDNVPVHLLRNGGEQHSAEHVVRHALRQIPVLEVYDGDSEYRLTQSVAIIEWLDESFDGYPLYPSNPLLRAHAREVCEVVNSAIQPFQNLATLVRVEALGISRVDWARPVIERGLFAIEEMLERSTTRFGFGDAPGVTEAFVIPQLYSARRFKIDTKQFGRLERLERDCESFDAFRSAHPNSQPDAQKD